MNILFIGLFEITDVYLEISKKLSIIRPELQFYWYVSDEIRFNFLRENGVDRSYILTLYDATPSQPLPGNETLVSSFERSSTRRFWQNIQSDRFVYGLDRETLLNEGAMHSGVILDFFNDKEIQYVFGEPTNRDVLMIAQVCEQLNIPFLFPQDARIPHDHLLFQEGVSTNSLSSGENSGASMSAAAVIENFRRTPKKPKSYSVIESRLSLSAQLARLKNRLSRLLVRNRSLVHHTFSRKLAEYCLAYLRSYYLDKLWHFNKLNLEEVKYAYYPLHVQPELSIDVLAPYYTDQLNLIKSIAISLPCDTVLLVKEHPNFIGQKPLSFFSALTKVPNVCLVHHKTDSFKLTRSAEVVFTVSGTVAFEAALQDVPAIIFCDIYFDKLSCVFRCIAIEKLPELIDKALCRSHAEQAIEKDLQSLLNDFYPGYWTDAHSDPRVLDRINIDQLAFAFSDVMKIKT